MTKVLKYLYKYRIALLFIFLFFVFVLLKDIFIIMLFIAVGALSLIHMRFSQGFFGLELCTFFTVLGGIKYGAIAGAFIGVVSITLGLFIGGYIKQTIIINMVGFFLIGIIASFFPMSKLFFAGVVLTVAYDAAAIPLFYFLGGNPVVVASYGITHIILNIIIFSRGALFL